jgi:hypothetical protein
MSTTYPKGKYQAEVLEQGFEESSTGTPCFFLQLKILGRYDEQGQLQECPPYERTYRQYLANEPGARFLRSDLKTLGVQISDLTQLDPAAPNHVSLLARKIDVECHHEVYQGKPRERWAIPRSRKKCDLGAVRVLNDKFGHLLRDGNGQTVATPPPVAAANDSDAPF